MADDRTSATEIRLIERIIGAGLAAALSIGLASEAHRRDLFESRLNQLQTELAAQTATITALNRTLERIDNGLEEHRRFHFERGNDSKAK